MSFYPSHAGAHDTHEMPSLGDLTRWGRLATAALMLTYGDEPAGNAGPVSRGYRPSARVSRSRWAVGRPAWRPSRAAVLAGQRWPQLAGDRGVHVARVGPAGEADRRGLPLLAAPREPAALHAHLDQRHATSATAARTGWRAARRLRVEWDAEIINEVENQVIGWRSLPGGDVVSAGSVNFDTVAAGRSTQLTVHLQYAPPAGRFGALVRHGLRPRASQTIREDLRRLKQLLEAGEIARKPDAVDGHGGEEASEARDEGASATTARKTSASRRCPIPRSSIRATRS